MGEAGWNQILAVLFEAGSRNRTRPPSTIENFGPANDNEKELNTCSGKSNLNSQNAKMEMVKTDEKIHDHDKQKRTMFLTLVCANKMKIWDREIEHTYF